MGLSKKRGNLFSEIIGPVLIIMTIVVGSGVLAVNSNMNSRPIQDDTMDLWEKAFNRVEESKVGIAFNTIDTPDNVFNQLRRACNEFIESIDTIPDVQVDINMVVEEDIFVDGDVQLVVGEAVHVMDISDISETGPIYFNDRILIRYINKQGELKIVGASIAEQDGEVAYGDLDNLDIEVTNKSNLNFTSYGIGQSEDLSVLGDKLISEEEYLARVEEVTLGILKANNVGELSKHQRNAMKYFTLDGAKTVIDGRMILGNSNIESKFIKAGKSNLGVTYKDRIYMQVDVTDGVNKGIYGIILKLDSNSRIFDIDII